MHTAQLGFEIAGIQVLFNLLRSLLPTAFLHSDGGLTSLSKKSMLFPMEGTSTSWPHAPEHRLCERGTYIVTCGTYRKQLLLDTPEKLALVRNLLFEQAQKHGWRLQA